MNKKYEAIQHIEDCLTYAGLTWSLHRECSCGCGIRTYEGSYKGQSWEIAFEPPFMTVVNLRVGGHGTCVQNNNALVGIAEVIRILQGGKPYEFD